MSMSDLLKKYIQVAGNDFLSLRRYFYNGFDLDPTFDTYQSDFEYCKERGFVESHKGLTPFVYDQSLWTKDYYDKIHGDLLRNLSSYRVKHLKRVARFVFKTKIEKIEARRRREQHAENNVSQSSSARHDNAYGCSAENNSVVNSPCDIDRRNEYELAFRYCKSCSTEVDTVILRVGSSQYPYKNISRGYCGTHDFCRSHIQDIEKNFDAVRKMESVKECDAYSVFRSGKKSDMPDSLVIYQPNNNGVFETFDILICTPM